VWIAHANLPLVRLAVAALVKPIGEKCHNSSADFNLKHNHVDTDPTQIIPKPPSSPHQYVIPKPTKCKDNVLAFMPTYMKQNKNLKK